MKTCASKISHHNLRYQRLQCPPLFSLPHHHYHHHQQIQRQQQQHSKSRTMSFNGTLKVFVNGAWITWIYLFAIFIRLEYVDAKIGYFWHITDLHLDTSYSTKGDVAKSCWHIEHHQTNSGHPPPGRFGDYMCDSPWSLLESATQAMKSRQGDNVEFVLWTGDALAHSMRRNIETHRLDVLRNITDLLSRTFPSQFVFPVLGHEDGQGNNFRRLGELWRHWLPNEALETFNKGGYYTIEQRKSRLRIIALNTNFMRHDVKYTQSHSSPIRQRPSMSDLNEHNNYRYHHGNHYRSNGINGYSASNIDEHGGTVSALSGGESHEAQKQWEWLEAVLEKSSRNKETVYIVGHIPPGSDERHMGAQPNGHITVFSEKNNLRYLQLVRKHSSIILGQFFGHLHSDSFRIIYNDNGKPVSWIMIAPSVTPKKQSIGSNNPAMRLYKFDTDTGQVLDYTQYFLNLAEANSMGEALWQPEYNLTTHYFGSGEVTAVALHNLADRFSNTENPFFMKYYRANSVRYSTPSTSKCEGVCALNHYCAITRVDYHEFRHCLESAASALASNSARSNVCIPIAANIALLLATYTIMKCQQRKLLFEWLQFLIVDLVIGVLLLVKCSRKLIVIMLDALLSSQWLNNCAELHVKSSSSSSSSSMQMISDQNVYYSSDNSRGSESNPSFNEINDFIRFSRAFIGYATHQVCCICARISKCMEYRLHEPLIVQSDNEGDDKNTMQKMQLPMPSTHQYSYQFSSSSKCKSCQTKLFTNVDSLKQMHKPMDSVSGIDTSVPYNV